MFTWICPQCGREVPPAYTDCPDCSKKTAPAEAPPVPAAQSPVAVAPPPPGPPEFVPPARVPLTSYPPPPAVLGQVQGPPYAVPEPSRGLPTWLMTIVFTLAFLGLVAGIYWVVGYLRGTGGIGGGSAAAPPTIVESPAAKPGAKTNPLQKYIEVSGVRFVEGAKKKPEVKFILTNHSGADITGLAGNVTIWSRTRASEEDAAGTFSFKTNIGPFESKELSAPLNTKKEMVELPDWQFVSPDIQITSPGA